MALPEIPANILAIIRLHCDLNHDFEIKDTKEFKEESIFAAAIESYNPDEKSFKVQDRVFGIFNDVAFEIGDFFESRKSNVKKTESDRKTTSSQTDFLKDYQPNAQAFAEKWWNTNGKHPSVIKNLATYSEYFKDAAAKTGVPEVLLIAVCAKESTMGVGSKNVMQLQYSTAKAYGCTNKYNPEKSILAAAKYLKHLIDKADGNVARALVGYNCGEYSKNFKNFNTNNMYANQVLSLCQEYEKRMC